AARHLYGLSESLTARDIQHPMMARVYWEMRDSERARLASKTKYHALSRFVELKFGRIAQALAPNVILANVENGVRRVARSTLDGGGFEVSREEFSRLFADSQLLGNKLVEEGVFTMTSSGVRFAFDEVGEFVQSQLLDKETVIRRVADWHQGRRALTGGAVVFAALRFEDEGHDEHVADIFGAIVAGYSRHEGGAPALENVIVQLLPQLRQPARFAAEIEALARQMARRGNYWFEFDIFGLRSAVVGLDVPLRLKIDVLGAFMPKENSYEFEPHHWPSLEVEVLRSDRHTGALLGRVIQSSPVQSFDILKDWLTDATRLRGSNATMADVAAALMFYYRHLAFDELCELLARSPVHKAEYLLANIAQSDTGKVVDVCLRWAEGGDDLLRDRAARLCRYVAGYEHDAEMEAKLYSVFSRSRGTVSREIDVVAEKGIGRLKTYRGSVVQNLLARFERGDRAVDGYDIAEWASTHFELIVSTLSRTIKAGRNPEGCSEALSSLSHRGGTADERDKVVDLLYLGAGKQLFEYSTFRLAVEYMLNNVDSESLRRRMRDFVSKFIAGEREIRLNLGYFAVNPYKGNKYLRELQDEVIELLITHAADNDERGGLLIDIAARCLDRPDPLGYVLRLGETMDAEEFHLRLIGAALSCEAFSPKLVEWLTTDARLPPFGLTRELLDKVRGGQEPVDAVLSVVDDFNKRMDQDEA
ncbi:MAG TPA: hypothetical protein VD861_09950, partial [Pyrinomonadaceae bacterium]|nr:hypothetical protein [Pyrinomonadaceae bacterium]